MSHNHKSTTSNRPHIVISPNSSNNNNNTSSTSSSPFTANQQWLQTTLSESEIEQSEQLFHDETNMEHQFCLACVLIKSNSNDKLHRAISIFNKLLSQTQNNNNNNNSNNSQQQQNSQNEANNNNNNFSTSSSSSSSSSAMTYRREALYYCAFAHVKLNKMFEAKRLLYQLLHGNNNNNNNNHSSSHHNEHAQGKLLMKSVEQQIQSCRSERRSSAAPLLTTGTVITGFSDNNNNSNNNGNSGNNNGTGSRLNFLMRSTPENTQSDLEALHEMREKRAAMAMMAQSMNQFNFQQQQQQQKKLNNNGQNPNLHATNGFNNSSFRTSTSSTSSGGGGSPTTQSSTTPKVMLGSSLNGSSPTSPPKMNFNGSSSSDESVEDNVMGEENVSAAAAVVVVVDQQGEQRRRGSHRSSNSDQSLATTTPTTTSSPSSSYYGSGGGDWNRSSQSEAGGNHSGSSFGRLSVSGASSSSSSGFSSSMMMPRASIAQASFVKMDFDAIVSRIPSEVKSLLTGTFHSFDLMLSSKKSGGGIGGVGGGGGGSSSSHVKCSVIDQEQFCTALGLLSLGGAMGQFANQYVFRGFYMLERAMRSVSNGVTYINQRKFREGEEICYETFMCGMGIMLYGTEEERAQLSFMMLDVDRKGYLVESDFALALKTIYEVGATIGLDAVETVEETAAKLFRIIDIYGVQQLNGNEFMVGLSKYRYLLCSSFISNDFKMNLSNATPRGVPALFGTTDWDYCLSIMLGIRQAQDLYKPLKRDIIPEDFSLEVSLRVPKGLSTISTTQNGLHHSNDDDCNLFIDYAPRVFRKLREKTGISEAEYMYSIGPDQLLCNLLYGQLSGYRIQGSEDSGGRSGSSFLFTHDGKFIIKNVSGQEFANFRRVLPEYYNYLNSNPNSLIMRVYGCFVYDGKGYIVMRNVFCTGRQQHEIYDLKGSTVARSNPDGPVYKDMDLTQKIVIGPNKRTQLLNILNRDIKFLCDNSFTDYSLLVGIHYVDGYEGKAVQDMKNKSDRTARNWQEELSSEAFKNSLALSPDPPADSNPADDPRLISSSQLLSESSRSLQQTPEKPALELKSRNRSGRPRTNAGRIQLVHPLDRKENLFLVNDSSGSSDNGIESVDKKQIYYLGIVDTLTEFSVSKAVELNLKTIKYGMNKRSQISSQPSGEYAQRIKTFIDNLVQ